MTRAEKVWAAWLITVLSTLLILERRYPKLCHCIRRWLRIEPQQPGHRIAGAALLVALAVFGAHILDQHQETS